ncbi:SEC14, partial [Symbiodinium pilosum]
VPHSGFVSFAFRFPMELGSDQDATTLISRINQTRKLKVGLVDFVKVAQLFNSLADVEARLLFLEAMAADLNLKLSHVRYLSELDPVLRGEVVDRLLPAVPEINTLGGFDLAVNSVHQKASLCRDRAAIVNLLLFNPACADGRYEFDVTEPAHRKMLDDLIIVNHWERDRAKRLGRPDLSKHGDHECIRNCSVNGIYRVWRSADVQLPPRAEISFDYCSPFHPEQGTPNTPDRTIRLLRQALATMDFNQSLKVKVLRSIAHRLVLTPQQCGWLLEALPATALELDTEIRDSPRVEAFVVLYSRCNNIAELLSDEESGLYSLVHLTREEVLTVRKRLGRTRTWDITRAGQEFIIPPPEAESDINPANGRMVLMTRRASNAGGIAGAAAGEKGTKPKSRTERMAEASIDFERMKPILQDYNMLDNPVSLGHANRYMMDLALHEDWHCAQCLLRVCKEEAGENIDAPYWSEKAHLADKGSKWLVPDEWYKEMPKVGIFGMTFLQGFNDPDIDLRLRLAKEWLGW